MSSHPPTRAPAARSDALDRLRGVALAAMLVHHLIDWQTGDARAVLPGWPSFVVTDVAAVAFFVAAGASLALFVAARLGAGTPRGRVAAQVLRRYGLLVPIGVTLDWALWRDPMMFGVLEALGVCVVLGAAVAAVVPARLTPAVAAATLAAGIAVERAAGGSEAWVAREVLAGKFPLVTYVGFVLVGVAAARTGRHRDRRWVAGVTLAAVAATAALLAGGVVPDRYPGDAAFVVPGLAGAAAAYALAQAPWPRLLAPVDRVVRRAAAYTLGIFVAHYLLYGVLRHTGLLGDVPGVVAVPAALAVTVAACLLAPRVPQPPWSLRTGRRRARPDRRPTPTARAPGAAAPPPAAPVPAVPGPAAPPRSTTR
jgi:hypothetical protein